MECELGSHQPNIIACISMVVLQSRLLSHEERSTTLILLNDKKTSCRKIIKSIINHKVYKVN